MSRPKVLCILPTPRPFAGPEVESELLLKSSLKELCSLLHIRSNIRESNRDKGKVDLGSVIKLVKLCGTQIIYTFRMRPSITYTLLSQNKTGFMRDACFIFIAKLLRQTVVVHFHGGGFQSFYNRSSWLWKCLIKHILKMVDRVIVQANCLKSLFTPFLAIDKIKVLHIGIETSDFARCKEANPVRVEKNGTGEKYKVLFIGHLSIAKGFGELLKAIPMVVARESNTEFIVVGEKLKEERNIVATNDGSSLDLSQLRNAWAAIEEDDKLNKCLIIKGTVYGEEKIQLFADVDLLVLPSYSEGFPLSIIEAMAAGLPVVCTPVGAIPEVIEDGVNGIIIQPGKEEELAEAMIKLIGDEVLREKMAVANIKQAQESYDIEKIARSMYEIFNELN